MAKLAEHCLNVKTEIKRNLRQNFQQLVNHLGKGWPILLPYDTDANHEPSLRKGHSAHWALILGFCLVIRNSEQCLNEEGKGYSAWNADKGNPGLAHLPQNGALPHSVLTLIEEGAYVKAFLYGKQGKSMHLKLWDFEAVCRSNENLVEMDSKRDQSQFVLPEGGVERGLCNQTVFIWPNSQ